MVDDEAVDGAAFRLERGQLVVAVVEDDVVFLGVAVMAVEDPGGGQAEGFEVGADQLGGDDPGRGEIDERGLAAVATFPRVLPLIGMG
ncbi:MAG: hypothetical protein EBV68_14335 [Betaproteobacteria bacterium]|nr:hypothetical protein [Betaproteobacteria bacterium]